MKRADAIRAIGSLALGGTMARGRLTADGSAQAGGSLVTDVRAFGAKGDGSADDSVAIQATIDAVHGQGGGVVWFPRGRYRTTTTLAVPRVLNQSIVLRGEGMRNSYIYPASSAGPAVRFGDATPDDSGSSAHVTQYCGMEDLSVSGSLFPSGGGCGIEFVEMQKGWIRNAIIEAFANPEGVGLQLTGSRTMRGVGAPAGPHTWRCTFINVLVANTTQPLVIDNGDECDFFSCNFGLPLRVRASADSLAAVEILQGHNNRFFGLLVSGERDPAYRSAYVGVKFTEPTQGDNLGHQVYGLVAEGCNHGVWVGEGVRDISIRAFDSSISAHAYWNGSDDGEVNQERQNNVTIETLDQRLYERTRRSEWPQTLTFPNGATAPSVKGSDTYSCGNTTPTTITDFADARPGQVIFVRLDANTRISAGQRIRPSGNADIVGAPHLVVAFAFIGGIWEQISASRNA